jgi:hypothetical protein
MDSAFSRFGIFKIQHFQDSAFSRFGVFKIWHFQDSAFSRFGIFKIRRFHLSCELGTLPIAFEFMSWIAIIVALLTVIISDQGPMF